MSKRSDYNGYMRQYMLSRYHQFRCSVIGMLGGECVVCGTADGLEIDHIDVTEKSFSISRLWSVSEAKLVEEIKKCQLLCREHHKEKTKANKDIVRGRNRERDRNSTG